MSISEHRAIRTRLLCKGHGGVHKKDKGEPPADVLAVHNYIRRKQIECETQIKAKQSLYK